jgi:hypothetical protein
MFPVFPKHGSTMLQVPRGVEKGNADRLVPIAPRFALFSPETSETSRRGLTLEIQLGPV